MINILLCDEDPTFIYYLHDKIVSYFKQVHISCFNITCFYSLEELLQANVQSTDIIFLNVEFQSMNGIEAAKILRKKSKQFLLIFVSNLIQYAPAGYKVNAFRYILKEQIDQTLEETMEDVLKLTDAHKDKLTLKFIGFEQSIDVYTSDIIYVESQLHKITFHLASSNERFKLYDKLDAVEQLLPTDEFIRIHQSYLVNFQYFLSAKNYTAHLRNHIKLPISQRYFPVVKKKLLAYKGEIQN